MKIRHRVPIRELKSDPITPEYQEEVDRSTAALERQYARAQKRADDALRRAERVAARPSVKPAKVAAAWAEVELRRQELGRIEMLMRTGGATATHRGRKSYRPVPPTHGVPL